MQEGFTCTKIEAVEAGDRHLAWSRENDTIIWNWGSWGCTQKLTAFSDCRKLGVSFKFSEDEKKMLRIGVSSLPEVWSINNEYIVLPLSMVNEEDKILWLAMQNNNEAIGVNAKTKKLIFLSLPRTPDCILSEPFQNFQYLPYDKGLLHLCENELVIFDLISLEKVYSYRYESEPQVCLVGDQLVVLEPDKSALG